MDLWHERAQRADLRAVLDPGDARGLKNEYIDLIHQIVLARAFPLAPTDVALDLGCGIGRLSAALASRAGWVVGMDATWLMVQAAAQYHCQDNLHWTLGAGDQLPWRAEAFDKVLSVFVLQHVLDAPTLARVIAEVARVLKPHGQLVLIEQIRAWRGHTQLGYIRQRAVNEYITVCANARLIAKTIAPIRVNSLLTHAAARGWIPPRWLRRVAQFDSRMAVWSPLRFVYADYFFLFEKGGA